MRLYNSLTLKKDEFVPLEPGKVKMYSCGPTVYNYFHVGNSRPFIVFDTLRRYLEYRGFEVTFVQNFTDIDDKVIRKANDENTTYDKIADRYIEEYFTDAQGLGIKKATFHPKATENIDEIINIVKTLEDKGFAYESGGDVYFSTHKDEEYGKLSHQPMEDLEAGARINVNEQKNDPIDFALWKKAKPGEPSWPSPWGEGRPGWHIECSAMARRYLGETIDIHSGGVDLCFPHHENEIAQSECANGKPFARYWLHNAFLNINNQKMSKSTGNFFTVRDAAKMFGYPAIRFFMLSAHYRSPINYSAESLEQSNSALARINTAFENLHFQMERSEKEEMSDDEKTASLAFAEAKTSFCATMDDDLNTADAIGVIFDLVRSVNSQTAQQPSKQYCTLALAALTELCDVLNITPKADDKDLDSEIEDLIAQRNAARTNRDFALSDKIRDDLKAQGITLEDTPQGVKWTRA